MAYFFRLIVLALSLGSLSAHAVDKIPGSCASSIPSSVPLGIEMGGCGGYTPGGTATVVFADDGLLGCKAGPACGEYGVPAIWLWAKPMVCPPSTHDDGAGGCVADTPFGGGECKLGTHKVGDACVCDGGTNSDGSCKDTSKCTTPMGSATGAGTDQYTSATYGGGTFCNSGCMVVPAFAGKSPSGQWFANGPLTSTGANCPAPTSGEGSPSGDPQVPPTPCKAGEYAGQINGKDVCVPTVAGTSNKTSTGTATVTDSSGTGTSTTTTMTTTSTTCNGDKCSTSSTRTPPDTSSSSGGSGGSSSTPESDKPKDAFCTENPKSPMCKEGTFTGACSGGFTCDGDAVQCAMAREQHARNCALFDDRSSLEAQLYDTQKGKEGNQNGSLPGNSSFSIGPGSFDTSDALGGGPGCISDKTITVMGVSASLPFSRICSVLVLLGYVNLACAYLLAARIVTRG